MANVAYNTTSSNLAFGGNGALALPSGSAANDLIVAVIGTIGTFTSFTGITGWTEPTAAASITGWTQRCWYKLITAGDVSTGTVTANMSAGYSDFILHRFTNVDTDSPVPASGGATVNTGTSTAPSGSSCTVDRSGSLVLRVEVNATGATRNTGPAGFSATTGSPLDANIWGDYATVAPASTGNVGSTLNTSDNWAVHMLVFQPVSSGGGVTVATPAQVIAFAHNF